MARAAIKEKPSTEEIILEAALHLFAERGFHGTAVPLVAQRAKVGAGTLYRYFASKEALVNALFVRWKGALASHLMSDFPVGAPARQKFHEMWRRLVEFARTYPEALKFLELHHHHDYLDANSLRIEQELMAPLRALIEMGQAQEEYKKIQPDVLACLVFGGFKALMQLSWQGQLELTAKVLSDAEECSWQAIRR